MFKYFGIWSAIPNRERVVVFMKLPKKFPDKLWKEVIRLSSNDINVTIKRICGEEIGSGNHRDVYNFKLDDRFVVKIEKKPANGMFCNITEYRNWHNMKDVKPYGNWLAPCYMISWDGRLLIQAKVNWDGKRRKDYPTYIPSLFTDMKLKNFGWIDDRVVCCDYAFMRYGLGVKSKFRYAKWFGSLKHYG